jgi:hypothetical protein
MMTQKRNFLLMLLVGACSLLPEAPLAAVLPTWMLRADTCVWSAQSSVSQFLQRNVPSMHDRLQRYGNHRLLKNPYFQLSLGLTGLAAFGYGLYTMYPKCCLRGSARSSENSSDSTNFPPLEQQQTNYASSSNQSSPSSSPSLLSIPPSLQNSSIKRRRYVASLASMSAQLKHLMQEGDMESKISVQNKELDTMLRQVQNDPSSYSNSSSSSLSPSSSTSDCVGKHLTGSVRKASRFKVGDYVYDMERECEGSVVSIADDHAVIQKGITFEKEKYTSANLNDLLELRIKSNEYDKVWWSRGRKWMPQRWKNSNQDHPAQYVHGVVMWQGEKCYLLWDVDTKTYLFEPEETPNFNRGIYPKCL